MVHGVNGVQWKNSGPCQVIVAALFVFTVPERCGSVPDAHWATDLRDLLGRRVIQLLLLGWLLTGVLEQVMLR